MAQSTTGAAPGAKSEPYGIPEAFSQGALRLTRLEACSAGVFAIIVTLLVRELKVPAW
jgi:hypothetical protein